MSSACPLCGLYLLESVERRYQTWDTVCCLLQRMCVPTGMVFQSFMAMIPEGEGGRLLRVAFCIPCINWIRRLCKHESSLAPSVPARRIPIPMDEFLLFLYSPGEYRTPDMRSLPRLWETLMAPPMTRLGMRNGNPYLSFAPLYTARARDRIEMLRGLRDWAVPGELFLCGVVLAWWDHNGQPVAFLHKVRALVAPRGAICPRPLHDDEPRRGQHVW